MRARAARPNNESPGFPAKSGVVARSFPLQAKQRSSGPVCCPNDMEREHSESTSRPGGSFGDVSVFPQQRGRDQGGNPLPAQLRQKMESAFESDFSDVRVHQGPSADSLGALAFTQGRDIHFAPGQYNPASTAGQRIIAHELTHVVQQRQRRVAVPSGGGVPLNENASLESEADTLGARAVQGQSVVGSSASQGKKVRMASIGVAPIQGMMGFGGDNKGGGKYGKLIDEDEQEAQEMAKEEKTLEKSLKKQTKENISKNYGNLHPTAQKSSEVANKVGKGVGYLGKGVTLFSGGSDMGIGAMSGKGIETGIKGTTKGIEMYNKHQDYQDPLNQEQGVPLIPKVDPKSNLQSKVELGGTIAKGLVSVGNEVGGFFGAPDLPTSQINQGIDLATKGGSKLAQKYDEQKNESNMNTGDEYQQRLQRLKEYKEQQSTPGPAREDPFADWGSSFEDFTSTSTTQTPPNIMDQPIPKDVQGKLPAPLEPEKKPAPDLLDFSKDIEEDKYHFGKN